MTTDYSSPAHTDQWQRMLAIVSQHPDQLQSNLASQFKKLFLRRLLVENTIVFLLQYTGLMISTLQSPFSPLWLASGTACAFIFLRGYSIVPGIWLGSFSAYYLAHSGIGLACGAATVLSLQAVMLLWICFRFIGPTLIFYRKLVFVKFIFCCSVLTAMTSLILAILCFSSIQFWLQWWLADLGGILILSCAVIAWDMYFTQLDALKKLNVLTLSLSYGLLLAITMVFLSSSGSQSIAWFGVTTLPIVLFISVRFGWCGAISAVFLLGLLLTLAVFVNAPYHFSPTLLIYLQLTLIIETIIGLLIAIKSS